MVEVLTVVAVVGLLCAIAVPNYIKSRDNSRLNTIYNNLRVLEDAKEQWALENRRGVGEPVDITVIASFIGGGKIKPVVNELYVPNPIGTPAGASLPTGVSLGKYDNGAFIPLKTDF